MPTLIRLLVILLVLAGLVYGGMIALVMFVKPPDKEITVTLRARDLMPAPERDPLVQREIDTSRTADSPAPVDAEAAPAAADGGPAASSPSITVQPENSPGDVVTLAPGVE